MLIYLHQGSNEAHIHRTVQTSHTCLNKHKTGTVDADLPQLVGGLAL